MTIKPWHELAEGMALMSQLLQASIDPETGEYIPPSDEALEEFFHLSDLNLAKAAAVAHIIHNAEADSKQFHKAMLACSGTVKRLKEYVLSCLNILGMKSIGEHPFSLNVQASPVSVDVPDGLDLSTWEDKFKRVKVEPNKVAILAAWKAGEPIPANVEIVEGEHIRIR